jgi:large subunit ribosomal protein L22
MNEEQKRIVEGGAAEPSETGDEAADAKQALGKEKAEEQAEAPAPKKPRRSRRRKAAEEEEAAAPEPAGEDAAEADEATEPQATGEEAAEETETETAEAEAETEEAAPAEAAEREPAEEGKPSRRRSADAAPVHKKSPAPRAADGTVVVRAQAKYVRHAPRKARLVVDHIRGKSIDEARAILLHTPRAAARDVLKLLESAVANAENNHELDADDLVIHKAYVDEGPTLKRYRPRALGRATRIRKRTSHMTIQLSPKE